MRPGTLPLGKLRAQVNGTHPLTPPQANPADGLLRENDPQDHFFYARSQDGTTPWFGTDVWKVTSALFKKGCLVALNCGKSFADAQ